MDIVRLPATEEAAAEVGLFLYDTFAKEHDFGGVPTDGINGDRAYAYIWRHINHAAWVAVDGEGIAGTISLSPRKLWWCDTEYWGDGWFYVRPEKRRSRAAVLLLKAAEAFARETGKPLAVNVWHSADLERKDAFFRRMGFAALGGFYIKGV